MAYASREILKVKVMEAEVELTEAPDLQDDASTRKIKLKFKLQRTGTVDVSGPLEQFCQKGRTITRPTDAIQVVNTIFNYLARMDKAMICIGNNVFSNQGSRSLNFVLNQEKIKSLVFRSGSRFAERQGPVDRHLLFLQARVVAPPER